MHKYSNFILVIMSNSCIDWPSVAMVLAHCGVWQLYTNLES